MGACRAARKANLGDDGGMKAKIYPEDVVAIAILVILAAIWLYVR